MYLNNDAVTAAAPPLRPAPAGPRAACGLLLVLLVLLTAPTGWAQAPRFQYTDAPVTRVIADVEAATDYRFLYRDALVTGKTLTFTADSAGVLDAFDRSLRRVGLMLQVDAARRQVLLTRTADGGGALLLGYVVDALDGTRLPFATVTWTLDGRLYGITAGEAGAFHLPLSGLPDEDPLPLTVSYVGYRPRTLYLDPARVPAELPVRLVPQEGHAHEVVVTGTLLHSDLDTTWHDLLQPGLLSTFGERSVLRSLQALPAVALSGALSPGLNVRGSRSDGFQVLLDGISIYNQTHLFGLFDAFNDDALQTVGLYYGITPARYQGPPGGTLSFVTRTGSQTTLRAAAGLSNTAVRATAEGPLGNGRGSWLLSGRHSYLDALDWFNNGALIAQGLDIGRETSAPPLPERLGVTPLAATAGARFYDLHAKLAHEADDGRRWMLTTYLGGDHTAQRADRYVQVRTDGAMTPVRRTVETRNDWGNEAASLHDQRPVGSAGLAHTLVGFSRYHSRYAKDDFTYALPPNRDTGEPRTLLAPFSNHNTLTEWKLAGHLDRALSGGDAWSVGYALHHYAITYEEDSVLRHADFGRTWRSTQLDFFVQREASLGALAALELGLRSHYFSEGSFMRLSPRLQLRLAPQEAVSASVGASRNHQFLHRLYLPYAAGTDVWVMSTAGQPPAAVDNVTAGLYWKAGAALFAQVEGYYKHYQHLRQHETTLLPRGGPAPSLLLHPWRHDNTAEARGLEAMVRHPLGPLRWTHSYTLSRVEIRNPALNEGRPFRADWDRTHQFSTSLQADLARGLAFYATWLFATGTPNTLAGTTPREPAVLPDYHRLDLTLRYRHAFERFSLETVVSAFNVYNQRNTWYRSPLFIPVTNGTQPPRRLDLLNVDVYDLGFQPSFSLSLRL